MANVKISELPVATSLSNGDSFPVVQGGVTKQAARSVLFASPTFTGTTTADLLTATGDVTFDGGAFVFNESGADKDARFEGDTDANLLFLDASTDRVGIGTATPAAKLHITNTSTTSGSLSLASPPAGSGGSYIIMGNADSGGAAGPSVILASNRTLQFGVGTSFTSNTGGTFSEQMRLDAGNLLVGSTSGTYRLTSAVSSGADRDIFLAGVNAVTNGLTVQWNHATSKIHVRIADIPTSAAGLPAGTLWSDGGTLKIA